MKENGFELAAQGCRWPSGRYDDIANIDISEFELARVFGCELAEGIEDGMGRWVGIGIILPPNCMVEMIRYDNLKKEGFSVRIDYGSDECGVVEKLLKILGKSSRDVLWINNRN